MERSRRMRAASVTFRPLWNAVANRFRFSKITHKDTQILTNDQVKKFNAYLDELQNKLYDAHHSLVREGRTITAEALKNRFNGVEDKSRMLKAIFQKHNDEMAALVPRQFALGTLIRYQTTLSHVFEFVQHKYQSADGCQPRRIHRRLGRRR